MSGKRLSTGEVARICSVNTDTVLKWIKKGRLIATRTAGGHYRIEECSLTAFIPALNLAHTLPAAASVPQQPLRCWEYLNPSGALRDACKKCVVYQIRAAWCFEVANLGCEVGQMKSFCTTSCQDCTYYQRASGQATNVLVITQDELFLEVLGQTRNESVSLRFARTAYEGSTIIFGFRPSFVVLDQELITGGQPDLLDSLAADPRLPGLRIILGVPKGQGIRVQTLREKGVVSTLEKPFGQDRIVEVIDRFPVELVPTASEH